MQTDATPTQRQRCRRHRRIWIGAGVTLIALGCIAFVAASVATRLTPAWWDTAIDLDDHSIDRARGFESALVTELNRVRAGTRSDLASPWKSQPWAVAMQSGDMNAWIEHVAPKWIATREQTGSWPRELVQMRISFGSDSWHIGVQIMSGNRTHFLAVDVTPRFEQDGSLWLTAHSVEVGRLQLPASLVLRRAPELFEHYLPPSIRGDPRSACLLDALKGNTPLAVEPAIHLADGRRVRILELHSTLNRLEIVARTERR